MKPILEVTIRTIDARVAKVEALIDSGAFYTIVRESALPPGTPILRYPAPREWSTAAEGGTIQIAGSTELVIEIGDRMIEVNAHVAPNLAKPLVIGAGSMQMWDITIRNANGKTDVHVGRDMREPDITMVL